MSLSPPAPEPFFAVIHGERLFCVLHPAQGETRLAALFVPPFAEEANKTRHLANRQARNFAAHGITALLVDPYGTGDSAGSFADATWARWCHDIAGAVAWLEAAGYTSIIPWCARLGAALARSAGLLERGDPIVLWQPVFSGRSHLNQFFRLRLAGDMTGSNRVSRADLEAALARDGYLDVGGYRLNRELVDAIQALDTAPPAPSAPVGWFDVSAAAEPALSRGARETVARWQANGCAVTAAAVNGDPYWATQELGFAPDLIETTTRWISNTR